MDKYQGLNIKQLRKVLEAKGFDELTLEDIFIYECIVGADNG